MKHGDKFPDGEPLKVFYPYVLFAALFILCACAGLLTPSASSAENLKLGGSGTTLGTMKLMGEAFTRLHPEVTVEVLPSLGSSGGIRALLDGAIDIALTSRPAKDEERGKGAISVEYGRTPWIFATSPDNGQAGFSTRQLVDIYGGKTTNWPNGAPIRLVLRPKRESDIDFMKSLSPEMAKAVDSALERPGMLISITDQETADHLEKIPGALGVSTLAQILSERRSLVPLALDGLEPSVHTLAEGSYNHFKILYLLTGPKSREAAMQFVDFVFSAEGKEILTRNGHLATEGASSP